MTGTQDRGELDIVPQIVHLHVKSCGAREPAETDDHRRLWIVRTTDAHLHRRAKVPSDRLPFPIERRGFKKPMHTVSFFREGVFIPDKKSINIVFLSPSGGGHHDIFSVQDLLGQGEVPRSPEPDESQIQIIRPRRWGDSHDHG